MECGVMLAIPIPVFLQLALVWKHGNESSDRRELNLLPRITGDHVFRDDFPQRNINTEIKFDDLDNPCIWATELNPR
jgi:hypothetical protein